MDKTLAKKITLLNQTVLDSLSESREHKILENFTETGLQVLHADFGWVWLKADEQADFKLVYKSRKTPYTPASPRRYGTNVRVEHSRAPMLVSNISKSGVVKEDARPYMKSFANIPIAYKNNMYGNIVFCFRKTHRFTPEERSLCTFVGNSAAQAITIQRLHKNLQNASKTLERRVKERTHELQESYKRLEEDALRDDAVLSSIGEGMIAVDHTGCVILINREGSRIFGFRQKDILGKNLFDIQSLYDEHGTLIPVKERPMYSALHRKIRVAWTANIYSEKKNGVKVPLSITVTPIVLRGKIIGAIEVFRDISKEKEIDRAKSELISLASHQLRTPLSAINWYTEALMKQELGPLNNDQQRYLKEINSANQKLIELVYDFLNVSRVELGTFNLKNSVINLQELTNSILQEISPLIANKELIITQEFKGELPAVEADRKVLRLILQNLITNAVKYTPAKGSIGISIHATATGKTKAELLITVSDTGYGIPKHQQEKIFSKLFRADNAAKLDTEGTGLGLYLVKSFVDIYKGKVSFESAENHGSIFTVKLPVMRPKAS